MSGELAEALARRTEALCAIESPIGHERVICDHAEAWARGRGFGVRRIKDSLVVEVDGAPASSGSPPSSPAAAGGEGRGEGDRPRIALCGHLDTVPIHDADKGRPPRREGGRLVAPGSSDMKGGVALAMELAERLPRAARFADLVLVLYAREEGPFLENELGDVLRAPGALSGIDLALCLEPTDNVLQLGCVGSIHGTFVFEGRSAHSARPWQGANAVHAAGALLAELHGRVPREAVSGGLVFREVASVTRIDGGRARNVVPDRCTLNVNFRFAPDKTLDAAARELVALGARFGAKVELTDLSPACPAYADHPLVKRLLERAGIAAEPKQAWTDVARLAQAGIPAANLGPGATAQAHQQGEWLELAALERGYRILEKFLAA
ncbi:succinyl-diaminopimelate desuccinylase [Anaeromyxobacter oryzae]|uniref:Succinyl-diaminopimelate desuccinylase n=1 Tax=Anaeromyxobacter oryzae TaxID=2918170 RepID=A0ABM7WTG3_9BACT|nr:succinyl-diaminopimelate desuccinylase [Anaeromyxobacter oryzae]BDG02771.1 succinyl-diaminopimelate desuccinylase [Anaeromyxobacter oryzae]